ncbi:MAG: hypothetical protein GVY26_13425 [Bacteroidetes bacterium]|jgi:hypothetical protein|nr:hypothetical protein [Bacteroidota bacterium]
MRYLLAICTFVFVVACGGEAEQSQTTDDTAAADTLSPTTDSNALQAQMPPPQQTCSVKGEVLDRNRYFSAGKKRYVVIKSDSSTRHPELGHSHRILEVYAMPSCSLVQRQTLPVNISPDFPYYIAAINYNSVSRLLAVHGAERIYLYDMKTDALRGPFEPQFASERYGVDAQSGHIKQLEVWEDYLIGYAQDYGAFAFKLKDDGEATPVMPLAEHESETQVFHQVFALSSAGGGQQLILPSYERRSNTFKINPVFEAPAPLNAEDMRTAQDQRFVLLQDERPRRDAIVLDLLEHKRRTLPADISRADNDDIVDWMEMMR